MGAFGGFCAIALLAGAALMPGAAGAMEVPAVAIGDGVYVHFGRHEEMTPDNAGDIANLGFIVGGRAVAVIDCGGSRAVGDGLRQAIRRVTPLPISHVVLTHVHPDHVVGCAAFERDAPQFVGHARLPAALAQRGGHYLRSLAHELGPAAAGNVIVPPNMLIANRADIDLGDRRVTLRAHATAHTDADLTAFDAASGTLFAGDLLFRERVPVIDGSIKGWLAVLDEIAAIPAARVVPGHGAVLTDWPGGLAAQRRYLALVATEIRGVLKQRGVLEQAIQTVGRSEQPRWLLFDRYHARNVTAAFVELEWE
jgi:quinoprotein relay system zinc metallohydrolase 2